MVEAFDAHVREQLPWYDIATGVVAHIARHFITPHSIVVDVGASTGNIGRAIEPTILSRHAHLIALDNSEQMVERYTGPGSPAFGDVTEFDFATRNPSLIVCFLCLMFVDPHVRRETIERMKDSLRAGGGLIVFDKREPLGGEVGSILYRLTLAAKYEAGAKADEIISKELSLAGVQRPLADAELRDFVEVFRFGDFAGWLYAKPKG